MAFVSGTVAADHTGRIHATGDAAGQASYVYEEIRHALAQAGASLRDVVRVRVYLTNIAASKPWGWCTMKFLQMCGRLTAR